MLHPVPQQASGAGPWVGVTIGAVVVAGVNMRLEVISLSSTNPSSPGTALRVGPVSVVRTLEDGCGLRHHHRHHRRQPPPGLHAAVVLLTDCGGVVVVVVTTAQHRTAGW